MNDIDAIKSKLAYSNHQEQEAAYASWHTVVAILADAYADQGMAKEEAICRWIVREGKIPAQAHETSYWWWFRGAARMGIESSILPFYSSEFSMIIGSVSSGTFEFCLNKLLSIPDEYISRFE